MNDFNTTIVEVIVVCALIGVVPSFANAASNEQSVPSTTLQERTEQGKSLFNAYRDGNVSAANPSLKNHSIRIFYIPAADRTPKTDVKCGGIENDPEEKQLWSKSEGFRYLSNLNSDRCVAVVDTTNSGKVVLNPDFRTKFVELDYGPIPPLCKLKVSEASILWGVPEKKGDCLTFKLQLAPHFNYKDIEFYYVDTVFSSEGLKKYRVRSNSILHSTWISL